MKHALKAGMTCIIIAILINGCGERKNAVLPEEGFSIVTTIPPVGVFRELKIYGDTGYLSSDYAGILVLDMADPGHPIVVDTIDYDYFGPIQSMNLSPVSGLLYVEMISSLNVNKGLKVYPFAAMNDTTGNIIFETGSPPVLEFSYGFESVRDSIGFAIVDTMIIYLIDNSESNKFQEHHVYREWWGYVDDHTNGYPDHNVYDYVIEGNYAYLAVSEYGMAIVDLANECATVGAFDTEGYCKGIDYQDSYCYLADWHWGLQVMDVSDPANPQRIANLKIAGADDCEEVKVAGNKAALLDKYNGVFGIDISDPANPELMFNFDTVTPEDIVVSEDYIYVIDEDAGLVIASW